MPSVIYSVGGSDTFICPGGITQVLVECWGGGGSGYWWPIGDGGGGGAYSRRLIPVTPTNSYNIFVGFGGSTSGDGSGIESSFVGDSSIACRAAPGHRVSRAGGQASACTGDIKYSGGNGGVGNDSAGAGGGAAAGTDRNGQNGQNSSGSTVGQGGVGLSNGGSGGNGQIIQYANGNGQAPGGGGGGAAYDLLNGAGNGADGMVIVHYHEEDVSKFFNALYQVIRNGRATFLGSRRTPVSTGRYDEIRTIDQNIDNYNTRFDDKTYYGAG